MRPLDGSVISTLLQLWLLWSLITPSPVRVRACSCAKCTRVLKESMPFGFARSIALWETDMSLCCDLILTMDSPSPPSQHPHKPQHTQRHTDIGRQRRREGQSWLLHVWNSVSVYKEYREKRTGLYCGQRESQWRMTLTAGDTPACGC